MASGIFTSGLQNQYEHNLLLRSFLADQLNDFSWVWRMPCLLLRVDLFAIDENTE
jgi:hypothetical protein